MTNTATGLNIGNTLFARPGELILLAGGYGTGKSTWLQRLAGLKGNAGHTITLNARSLSSQTIRMIGESWPAVWLGQSVHEELSFGLNRQLSDQQLAKTLAQWSLSELSPETRTADLNRLQSIRLSLAGSDLAAPGMLLLDNPTDTLAAGDASTLATEIATWATETKTIVVVACNRWQDWQPVATQQWQITLPDSLPQA